MRLWWLRVRAGLGWWVLLVLTCLLLLAMITSVEEARRWWSDPGAVMTKWWNTVPDALHFCVSGCALLAGALVEGRAARRGEGVALRVAGAGPLRRGAWAVGLGALLMLPSFLTEMTWGPKARGRAAAEREELHPTRGEDSSTRPSPGFRIPPPFVYAEGVLVVEEARGDGRDLRGLRFLRRAADGSSFDEILPLPDLLWEGEQFRSVGEHPQGRIGVILAQLPVLPGDFSEGGPDSSHLPRTALEERIARLEKWGRSTRAERGDLAQRWGWSCLPLGMVVLGAASAGEGGRRRKGGRGSLAGLSAGLGVVALAASGIPGLLGSSGVMVTLLIPLSLVGAGLLLLRR